MSTKTILTLSALFLATLSPALGWAMPGFTEDFTAGTANWATGAFTLPTAVASGGPDGSSFISFEADFASLGQGTLFRAHNGFDSSNDAFVGSWISQHWITLSAFVRHNAPVSAEFFSRVATSSNFPGAGIENFVSVPPNTWTEVVFDVRFSSPQITMEGPIPYASVFGNVGNVQIGVTIPAGYATDTTQYTFDLDKVSVAIPEPACGASLLVGLTGAAITFRRRKLRMEHAVHG